MTNQPLCHCGCGYPAPEGGQKYLRSHQLLPVAKRARAQHDAELAQAQQQLSPATPERPITLVEDDAPVVSGAVRRGQVESAFVCSYHDLLLQFAPGEIVVDQPLYLHLRALDSAAILWEQ